MKNGKFRKLSPEEMPLNMLIGDISHITRGKAKSVKDPPDLTPSGRNILFCLCHEDGLTQLDLSNYTHLKPPTVSVTLRKMEEDGYVVRRDDEKDRRQTRVYITEKGRDFDNKVRRAFEFQERAIVDALSPEERTTLKKLLLRVREAVINCKTD